MLPAGAALALSALTAGCGGAAKSPAALPSSAFSTTNPSPTLTPTPSVTPRPRPHPTITRTHSAMPSARPSPSVVRYVFPVSGCSASPSSSHHDYPAADIFAQKGCRFVAVVAGRVDEVSYVDRWSPSNDAGAVRGGRSVSIVGDDGVRYYGSHLLSIAAGIRPGARVRAGQTLGLIDNSGDARYTPTHVHFGISWPTRPGVWWVRRGEIWPQRYLAAWRSGHNTSPAAEVRRRHAQLGDVPPCSAEC